MENDVDADVTAWQAVLDATYSDAALNPVLVVDGSGLHVGVEHNQLVLTDGVGNHRRKRSFPRSNRTVRRLVILGRTGSITLAALRWCCDVGLTVTIVDPDGSLTAITAAPNPHDARLRRAQALAAGTDVGLSIARTLLHLKITGHADVLRHRLGQPEVAQQLVDCAARLDAASNLDRLREIESRAAKAYFAVWTGHVRARFATRERTRVPEHWTAATPRRSELANGGSPRKAVDPVNALLNYAYALGESVARHACQVLGLDPALGVLHTDRPHRDSMALDLLEALRPTIDTTVLDLLATRHFRRLDFTETTEGQCRLTETTTHALAASLPAWTRTLAPPVEAVARALSASANGQIRPRTPLTRASHRAAQTPGFNSRSPQPRPAATTAHCRNCGTALTETRRKLCSNCWLPERVRLATERASQAREARQAARDAGTGDPAQTESAQQQRSETLRKERALRNAWNREHPDKTSDRADYDNQVLPLLAAVPLSQITSATGMSLSAASRVRRGLLLPHARHWEALALLGRHSLTVTSP